MRKPLDYAPGPWSKRLEKLYGVDHEWYILKLGEQEGKCAICKCTPRSIRLAVDHNHKTGDVRGLLCSRCNKKLLGSANDSIERLKSAVAYLENYL